MCSFCRLTSFLIVSLLSLTSIDLSLIFTNVPERFNSQRNTTKLIFIWATRREERKRSSDCKSLSFGRSIDRSFVFFHILIENECGFRWTLISLMKCRCWKREEECAVPVNLWTLVCDRWISLCAKERDLLIRSSIEEWFLLCRSAEVRNEKQIKENLFPFGDNVTNKWSMSGRSKKKKRDEFQQGRSFSSLSLWNNRQQRNIDRLMKRLCKRELAAMTQPFALHCWEERRGEQGTENLYWTLIWSIINVNVASHRAKHRGARLEQNHWSGCHLRRGCCCCCSFWSRGVDLLFFQKMM